MLSLPSKPWKKVRIEALGNGVYRVTFLSAIASEENFKRVVEEDIGRNLPAGDRLRANDWPSRSVEAEISQLALFKRNLIFASIMVEAP